MHKCEDVQRQRCGDGKTGHPINRHRSAKTQHLSLPPYLTQHPIKVPKALCPCAKARSSPLCSLAQQYFEQVELNPPAGAFGVLFPDLGFCSRLAPKKKATRGNRWQVSERTQRKGVQDGVRSGASRHREGGLSKNLGILLGFTLGFVISSPGRNNLRMGGAVTALSQRRIHPSHERTSALYF